MKIKELIRQLQLANPDDEVELFSTQYSGGGDEETFTEPALRFGSNTHYLCHDFQIEVLEYYTGKTIDPVELDKPTN